MKKSLLNHVRPLVVCIMGLCIMVFFAACSDVATMTSADSNGTQTQSIAIQGKLLAVDSSAHSATFLYNGQQVTVNQLTDLQVATLQSQQGKTFTLQVTQTGATTYTANASTDVQLNDNPVAATTTTAATSVQPTSMNVAYGTIDFVGKVQSINASSISVTLHNGDAIPMALNAMTKREDFFNGQPTVGQQIKVDAYTNADGSFTAKKLDMIKPEDQADTFKMNTVDFKGVTTSAVGTDNVIHFKVGNKSYSYATTATTRFKDFVNPQGIAVNQPVKVEVLFNGTNGSVIKVENGID